MEEKKDWREHYEKNKESHLRAQRKYNKENTTSMTFRFSNKNDADVIDRLNAQENKSGYVKTLIRRDIAAEEFKRTTIYGQ